MQVNAHSNLLSICMALFLTVTMIGCKPKSESELYGTYNADYSVAKEKLTLNKDGTFVQEVMLKAASKIDVQKGTWTYNRESGYVTFHGRFMGVLDGFGKLDPDYAHPKPGLVVQPADKYFGHILIGAAEGILYKKID